MSKSTNQNSKIKRLPYTRLLKSEMADYADSIISIVESYNFESSIINPLFGLLKEKKPAIALLRLSYGVDNERLKINNLKGQLMLIISSFKLNVKMLKVNNEALDLHIVENAISSYLCSFKKCRNDKEMNQKVAGFLDLMDSNNEFANAVNTFNLLADIKRIKKGHDMFNNASKQRVKLLAERPEISTKKITKELFDAIDNLFKGLEIAQVINNIPDNEANNSEDLNLLISELKQLSDMYYKSFSLRKANNKRKLEKKQQNDSQLKNNDINDAENLVETDTFTNFETKVTTPNFFQEQPPLQICKSLIKQMNDPSSKNSLIKASNNSTNNTKVTAKSKLLQGINRQCSS